MFKKEKVPFLLILVGSILTLYLAHRGFVNYLMFFVKIDLHIWSSILLSNSHEIGFFGFVFSNGFAIVNWLASTKVPQFQSKKIRIITFLNMLGVIVFNYLWFITVPILKYLIPYFEGRLNAPNDFKNTSFNIFFQDNTQLYLLIISLPLILVIMALLWMFNLFAKDEKEILESFFDFEYPSALLQRFSNIGQVQLLPDVIIGPNSKTKELVVIPGKDRTLNKIIAGSIGTGKTATILLNMINQDLHWMTKFINTFRTMFNLPNYNTDLKQNYLNGLTIIEPSNDLCKKAYKLVKAHGIPEESVFYIDPTNPNTPCINSLLGPVEKVSEALTMVVEGLNEGKGNFYFEQSQRNHFKQYIYLLKLHDVSKTPHFDHLIDIYKDPQLVRSMHMKLKDTIPSNIDSIIDRDERNHWQIVRGVDEWFDMNHLAEKDRNGSPIIISGGKYHGQPKYYDSESESVKGLRNILDDFSTSPLIRRVLFGYSDFDFDKHLEMGGVLLVNTAKGELGTLSNVFGKLILLSIQNAVFRRTPDVSPYHSIFVDEFPDYIYEAFMSFPAQSRKYKTIVTVAAQTIAQLAHKYGDTYAETLLTTLRNKIVFADVSEYDAKKFSKIFGEVNRFKENTTESSVSPLQDSPMTRTGSSYTKQREAVLSTDDILMQDAFQCAVKIVKHNKTRRGVQVSAEFVKDNEWEEADITVEEGAADFWLNERRQMKVNAIFSSNSESNTSKGQELDVEKADTEVIDLEFEEQINVPVEQPIKATTIVPKKQPSKEYEVVSSRPKLRVGMVRTSQAMEDESTTGTVVVESSEVNKEINSNIELEHINPSTEIESVKTDSIKEQAKKSDEYEIIDFSQIAIKGLLEKKEETKNISKPNAEQQKVYDEIFTFVEEK